jgi:hypothetical protein
MCTKVITALSGALAFPLMESCTLLVVRTERSNCGRTAVVHMDCGAQQSNFSVAYQNSRFVESLQEQYHVHRFEASRPALISAMSLHYGDQNSEIRFTSYGQFHRVLTLFSVHQTTSSSGLYSASAILLIEGCRFRYCDSNIMRL